MYQCFCVVDSRRMGIMRKVSFEGIMIFMLFHASRTKVHAGLVRSHRGQHTRMPPWLGLASVNYETWTISKANPPDMLTQMAKASPSGNEVTSPNIRACRHDSAEESRKASFSVARQVCFQAFCKWHYYSQ